MLIYGLLRILPLRVVLLGYCIPKPAVLYTMADEDYQELGAEEVEHAIDDLAGIDNVRMGDARNSLRCWS